MCPANAKAISRWEGEGGARKSGAEEARDVRQPLPKEEERPRTFKNDPRKTD